MWDLNQSYKLNFGFWDSSTANLREALRNQSAVMAEKACIKADHHVLDAGCGVGGSAIFLAKELGCQTTGITIVPDQVKRAQQHALQEGVAHHTSFCEADFSETPFEDQSFDVVWGIESICYAEPKIAFIKEAYRLLKPGGQLVISEILAEKEHMNPQEYSLLMDNGFKLCMVNSLYTARQYQADLVAVGFRAISIEDCTALVRPSINPLHRLYYPATIYNWWRNRLGGNFSNVQRGNIKMLYYLHKSLSSGLWKYGLISAQKPF